VALRPSPATFNRLHESGAIANTRYCPATSQELFANYDTLKDSTAPRIGNLNIPTTPRRARSNGGCPYRFGHPGTDPRSLPSKGPKPPECESARGPDADRHVKLLIQFAVEGSLSGAYSHRSAVLEGLAGLGYEVTEGMSTAWVNGGRVVLRKAASPGYGVELSGDLSPNFCKLERLRSAIRPKRGIQAGTGTLK
jgi:hypothetical protein